MKLKLILLSLWLIQSLPTFAQQATFEQQTVVLANGEEHLLWISLDDKADLLHYKFRQDDVSDIYKASDVVSFIYGGRQYYSLPLRDGYFTFFKVYHEGKEFAVLEKAPNFKALRVIADESDGRFSMCQNRRSHEFYLCSRNDINGLPGGNNRFLAIVNSPFLNPAMSPSNPTMRPDNNYKLREFEVHKIVYLAIEGQLKLFYLETDERFDFWDDSVGPRPGKYKIKNMLGEFITDKQKISAIQKKAKQEKLDIRFPSHLIMALKAVYQ